MNINHRGYWRDWIAHFVCLIWLNLQLLIDIEFNIDEIPGLDPKKDAYVNEDQFLEDLRLIDVGSFSIYWSS